MILLIIIITITHFLISYLTWYYTSKAHFHPQGIYKYIRINLFDLIICFIPLLNIATLFTVIDWKDSKYKKPINSYFKTEWKDDKKIQTHS